MNNLVTNLKTITNNVLMGGGEKSIKNHLAKGKLLVRDRINLLIDKGSPFLELSTLAGLNMYNEDVINSGGIVTGVGRVMG